MARSFVVGAALITGRYLPGRTVEQEYARSLIAAYREATGRDPLPIHAHDFALVEQFTYRARNARGRRILDAARIG